MIGEAWIVSRHYDFEGSDVIAMFGTERDAAEFVEWCNARRSDGEISGDSFDAVRFERDEVAMHADDVAAWNADRLAKLTGADDEQA